MMQKELTCHEIEGEVVECPTQKRHPDLIIKALEGHIGIITVAALPTEDGNTFDGNVKTDERRGGPPNDGIAEEIDLAVVLAPEVDTPTKDGPGWRARIPGVGFDKSGVSLPHDFLKLPEFSEKAWIAVIDLGRVRTKFTRTKPGHHGPNLTHLLGVFLHKRMDVSFNVPDTIRESSALCAGHLLLFEAPVWKFDLVREEGAAGHQVYKSELRLYCPESLLCFGPVRHRFHDCSAISNYP